MKAKLAVGILVIHGTFAITLQAQPESATNCVTSPPGLVAWWRGENDSADAQSVAPLTLQGGVTFSPGKVGTAFSFDGVDGYATTSLDIQPKVMPNMTWEAWIFPVRINHSSRQTIFSDDNGDFDRTLAIESKSANFSVFTGTGPWVPTKVIPNEWQHVAVVYSRTNIEFYKNGKRFAFGEAPAAQETTRTLTMGKNPDFKEFYAGLIDDPTVYDRALSEQEILSIYEAGAAGKCPPSLSPPMISAPRKVTSTSLKISVHGRRGANVILQDGSIPLGNSVVQNDGTCTFSVLLVHGRHQLTARQMFEGKESEASQPVTVSVVPPQPSVFDAHDARKSMEIISGLALPGATVEIFEDDASLGKTTADKAGNYELLIPLAPGNHTITACQIVNEEKGPGASLKIKVPAK
jgi:hypothetical protein